MGRIGIAIIRNILGTLLIVLGIISGFIPLIQGWILILLGISLLQFPGKEKLLWRIRQMKYVKPLAKKLDAFRARIKKKLR